MRKLFCLSNLLLFFFLFQVVSCQLGRKTQKSDPEIEFQFSLVSDVDCTEFYHSDAEKRDLLLDNSKRVTTVTKSKQKCNIKYVFGCEGADLLSDSKQEAIPGYVNMYVIEDNPRTEENELDEEYTIEACTQMSGKFVKG